MIFTKQMFFTKKMVKVLKHFIDIKVFEVFEITFLKYEDKKTYFNITYLNTNYNIAVKTVFINNNNEVREAQKND